MSAIGTATSGIVASMRRFDDTATRLVTVSQDGTRDVEVARVASDLLVASASVQIQAAVVRTGNEATRRLLDILV